MVLFSSGLMKKSMFKRLGYTQPDLSPRLTCKVNLSNTKSPAWFLLGCLCSPVINSVLKNGLPGEGRHEGLVPRNDVLTNGFIGFSLARTQLHEYFLYLVSAPKKPRRRCEPEEGYLRCSKRFDHRIHAIIFLSFEFKSVDDVGAGKLREMLTLHTNPHAFHGRFTLKDDGER